eukprot:jgi/Mesvir1/24220/Mv10931-RA.1
MDVRLPWSYHAENTSVTAFTGQSSGIRNSEVAVSATVGPGPPLAFLDGSLYLPPFPGNVSIPASPLLPVSTPPQTGLSLSEAQRSSPLSSLFTFRQRFKRAIDFKRGIKSSDPSFGAKWRTCAVVGNGGVLTGRKRGPEIDAHDAVIRLNNAPIQGSEADVGTHTTVSVMNGHIMKGCLSLSPDRCSCFPYGPSVPVIVYACVPGHRMDFVMCRRANPRSTIFDVDDGLKALVQAVTKEYSMDPHKVSAHAVRSWHLAHPAALHYSTGMLAVVLSLACCERVDLYGFGSAGGQHHYFPSAKQEVIPDHDYPAEMRFYQHLVEGNVSAIPLFGEYKFELPEVTFALVNPVNIPSV